MGFSQATPTDARSYFFDTVNFVYRPYQDTAEVLAYLTLAKYRAGNFYLFINDGGTLNPDGTFTGGTISTWTFQDGTADGDLVEVTFDGSSDPAYTDITGQTDWDGTPSYMELTADTDLTITGSLNNMVLYVKQDGIGNWDLTINGQPVIGLNSGADEYTGVFVSALGATLVMGVDDSIIAILATPAPPTTPVNDDTANTFGWTDAGGLTFADAEYTINGGSSWAPATANPQTGIGNATRAVGQVGVRYAAVPGVSNASNALFNSVAFTLVPAAPTSGVVDDTLNTFDWTNTSGFAAASDYEYRIGGSGSFTTVPAKPLSVGNVAIAIGDLEVRVKAVTNVNTISASLTNSTAFTTSADTTPPTVTDMEAIDANTIEVTFDEIVTLTDETGWSFDNGAPLTISGVSGTGGTILTFTIVETMTSADTITGEYDDTLGDVADTATSPNPLASFGPDPVTNSIPNAVVEDFESGLGNPPAIWNFTAGNGVTNNSHFATLPQGGTNELQGANSGTPQMLIYNVATMPLATTTECDFMFVALSGIFNAASCCQRLATSTATSPPNGYYAQMQPDSVGGPGGVNLLSFTGGSGTVITSVAVAGGTFTAGGLYHIVYTLDAAHLHTITITRYSDGRYLDNTGTWVVGAADAISFTEGSPLYTTAGYAGFAMQAGASANTYIDNAEIH